MKYNDLVGTVVCLGDDHVLNEAFRPDGTPTALKNGRWEILEHIPIEPSIGVTSPCFSIFPADREDWENCLYSVDEMELLRLVVPAEYEHIMAREKAEDEHEKQATREEVI